jgi:hypothetical protein
MIGGEDYTEGTVDETSLEEPAPAASTVAPGDYEGDEYDGLFGGGEPLDSLDWDLITVADLDYRLVPAAAAAAEAQIRSAIDACAAPHALDLDTCPFELVDMDETVAHSVTSALQGGSEWTVNAYPDIDLVVDVAGQARVDVLEPGTATGTYIGPEDGPGLSLPWNDYQAELAPYGRVDDVDGEVVWTHLP